MRAMNRLSARAVATLGPGKYADGAGLWLIKRDDGGAQWVLRYTMHGRRREMGMGNLAQVSLKEARESADRWRGIVRAGKDPIRERERERREAARNIHLLKDIAQDAFEARKSKQAALPFGGRLGIEATAIDSSDGDSMETVYGFAFPRTARRIFAIKGVSGNRPFVERSKSKVKGGWLWLIGVDSIKTHLVSRLARPGSIRFSDKLDPAWFEQLVAERVVVRYSRGQPFRRFERIPGRRAEALDCVVYAFAVQRLINVNWSSREEQLRSPDLARPLAARPRTIPSSWMER